MSHRGGRIDSKEHSLYTARTAHSLAWSPRLRVTLAPTRGSNNNVNNGQRGHKAGLSSVRPIAINRRRRN